MRVPPDAFVHLPGLRGRVTPPEQSALRVTDAVLAHWDRRAHELGRPPHWRWTVDALEASRRAVLDEVAASQDLWVYAYGSLMWDPGVHFDEVRRADLHGFQRRFSYRTIMGRGTPQQPALMLSLEARPGCCQGLVYRLAADRADDETRYLWRREMLRGGYRPVWQPVQTPQGPVTALVFAANESHDDHVGELPVAETVVIIARASGVIGSNRAYLEQLAAQLQALAIPDAYVEDLARRLPV